MIYDRKTQPQIFDDFNRQKRICISGMPGVGKSTLAIEYGYSRKDAETQALVCFFRAQTEIKLHVDFIGLAKQLDIDEENDDH